MLYFPALLSICFGVLEPAGSHGIIKLLDIEDGLGKMCETLAEKAQMPERN